MTTYRKEGPSKGAAGTGDHREDVSSHWKEMMDQYGSEMQRLFSTGTSEYTRMMERWNELAVTMSENLTSGVKAGEDSPVRSWQDIYDSWLEGSKRMSDQFLASMDPENPEHRDFYERWTSESRKFSEDLSDQMLRGMKEQYELYELWMDSFSRREGNGDAIRQMGGIMGRHYEDFVRQLNSIFGPAGSWRQEGEAGVGAPDVKGYEEMLQKVQDAWLRSTSELMKDILASDNFSQLIKQATEVQLRQKEELDKLMESELRAMRLPSRGQMDDVYKALTELERRVGAMSDRLEEMREPGSVPKSGTGTRAATKTKPKAKPRAKAKPKSKATPKSKTKPKSKAKPRSKAKAKPKSKASSGGRAKGRGKGGKGRGGSK
jgi:polyhydroxyalkanoate synthesis regulator phasin